MKLADLVEKGTLTRGTVATVATVATVGETAGRPMDKGSPATVATVATVAAANGASTTNQINNSSSIYKGYLPKRDETGALATATPATLATHADNFKPIPKCLGIWCDHAGYVTTAGNILTLWCGHQEKAVHEIPYCPNGHWQKDAKGFPIPDPKLWEESWNRESDDTVIL